MVVMQPTTSYASVVAGLYVQLYTRCCTRTVPSRLYEIMVIMATMHQCIITKVSIDQNDCWNSATFGVPQDVHRLAQSGCTLERQTIVLCPVCTLHTSVSLSDG